MTIYKLNYSFFTFVIGLLNLIKSSFVEIRTSLHMWTLKITHLQLSYLNENVYLRIRVKICRLNENKLSLIDFIKSF